MKTAADSTATIRAPAPAPPARGRVLILNENESVPHDRRVWQIARSLTRAGFGVSVICPQGSGSESAAAEVRDAVEIHRYRPLPARGGALGYVKEYAWALLRTWILVRRLSRRERFDVVHACNPPDVLLLTGLSLRRRGARFVFDHHDLVPELYLSRFARGRDVVYRLTLLLERIAFALADVVIATNESYRQVALSRGRKRDEDVFVVRNAPDLKRFAPREPDPALKRGAAHLIGYVGVMGPQDGVDHALRALAALRRRRDDWTAVFVGEGDVLAEMQALAKELGLGDAVTFTGWLEEEDVVRAIASCDVCLAPEPKSPVNDVSTMVKVAEYLALGRPVAAYDLRETRNTAADAAVYAKPDDPESLGAAVAELLADPERRRRMGALARRRIEQALSWEHSERALFAAYEHVVRGRSGPQP